jgi:hypothetical protein
MSTMKDITKALASKYSGVSIEKKKEEPKFEPREYSTGSSYEPPTRSYSGYGETRIWPSERMELRDTKSSFMPPKRPPVLISIYADDELEWMFSTPAKRGWEFSDWLEVIGLPRDLHEKLDGAMYQYAARSFLNRKREAHQR